MIEIIRQRATLYRVGRADNAQGLWYDGQGAYTGLIHNLKDGAAGALPMGFDPIFRAEGRRWISVTESLETLKRWFSEQDMRELLPQGYVVQEIDAVEHRRYFFEGFNHEVYADGDALAVRAIDPSRLYASLGSAG